MSYVTQELLNRLCRQVEARGTVVWYDPDQTYADLAAALTSEQVAGATILRYTPAGGFFALRHDLESVWGTAAHAPNVLIYVPLERQRTHHGLIEYEVAGVYLQPGQQPPELDTALATVARHALAPLLPPAAVAKIINQVTAGQLTLTELDHLAAKGDELATGALAMIFHTGAAHEIALAFLVDDAADAAIAARQALPELSRLLADTIGVPLTAATPAELRRRLARQVLMTDYLAHFDAPPPAYASLPQPSTAAGRDAAIKLAQSWRNRRDALPSYLHWAQQTSTDMAVDPSLLALETLRSVETFLVCEQRTQTLVEQALLGRTSQRLLELIARRLHAFWAEARNEIKERWLLIQACANLLAEAGRIESALKGKTWRADALLSNYALGDTPWCALDTAHRRLEHEARRFDLSGEEHDVLGKLVIHARQRYETVAARLAELFVPAYAADQFQIPGVLEQMRMFHEQVAPAIAQGRTAYVLVDGLRYEMGRELLTLLEPAWQTTLHMALATPPTITEVGMAALLPGAERGVAVVPGKPGKVAVRLGKQVFKERKERISYFAEQVKPPPVVVTLDQLTPLGNKKLRSSLAAAHFVLVTASDEIDGLWEDNPALARRMMDDALHQLRRGLHTLVGLGIEHIIVTSDHGFIFGEPIDEGASIDAPGGQTIALKRRAWVGKGGTTAPGVLRRPLSAFGVGGDLELATPEGLAYFKAPGGSMEYHHGGLSLPELLIPVLAIAAPLAPASKGADEIRWQLAPGSKQVTTRFLSVTVSGHGALLPVPPQLVRVEVRHGGDLISASIAATYGFHEDSRYVELKPNPELPQEYSPNTVTVALMLEPGVPAVAVDLVDANTGRTLAAIGALPVEIAI